MLSCRHQTNLKAMTHQESYASAMAKAYRDLSPAPLPIDYKGMIRRQLGNIPPEHKQEIVAALLSLAEELGGTAK